MPEPFRWGGVTVGDAAVAWSAASRLAFAGLPWRDPLDDVVAQADRDLVDEALATLDRSTGRLHEGPSRRHNDPDLPLRRRIAGRFAAGGDRVLYVARDLSTAIAETRHHQERRARRSRDPAHPIIMRALEVRDVIAQPHDLRGKAGALSGLYDLDDYTESVAFAHGLRRTADPDGVLYDSVREAGGINLALFRRRYAAIVPAGGIELDWDGTRIRGWRATSDP